MSLFVECYWRKVVSFLVSTLKGLLVLGIALLITILLLSQSQTSEEQQEGSAPSVFDRLLDATAGGIVGAVVTVIGVDAVQRRRDARGRRRSVVSALSSTNRQVVQDMIDELRRTGEWSDGYLDGIKLQNLKFEGLDLSGVRLAGGRIVGCDFQETRITSADFRYTSWSDTDLDKARATASDLRGCTFVRTSIPAGARV